MNELIKQFEGCKLTSYKCSAGVWTIGWGNTFYNDGKRVREGETITQNEADYLLQWYCDNHIKVPTMTNILHNGNHNKVWAVQSLIFNIGQTAFDKSKLKIALEKNDIGEIFKEWNYINVGGKASLGLIRRRLAELTLYFK